MTITITKKSFAIFSTALLLLTSLIVITSKVASSSAADNGGNGFISKAICGPNGKSQCAQGIVGPGGGTIFYVDSENIYPGFDYLEVAPSNWAGSLGVDPLAPWCSDTKTKIEIGLTAWSSRAIGLGPSNTKTMLNTCTFGAANLISSYNVSPLTVKRDWYLPTIGCLLLMDDTLQGLAGLSEGNYWSSSGYSATGAWVQAMGHGYQGSAPKDSKFHVRPVRHF